MINKIKEKCLSNITINDDIEVEKIVVADYESLLDLRNRIAEATDNDIELYEEDHLTLDHILDYMEIFISNLKGED